MNLFDADKILKVKPAVPKPKRQLPDILKQRIATRKALKAKP